MTPEPMYADRSPAFIKAWGDVYVALGKGRKSATQADTIMALPCLSGFFTEQPGMHEFTVRRSDGESLGDFTFMGAKDRDDWSQIEDTAQYDEEPTEYVIEQWVRVGHWSKMFGLPDPTDDEDDYDPARTVRTVTLGPVPS